MTQGTTEFHSIYRYGFAYDYIDVSIRQSHVVPLYKFYLIIHICYRVVDIIL